MKTTTITSAEIDNGALVSEGDESGAYVAAWVWVNKLDAG